MTTPHDRARETSAQSRGPRVGYAHLSGRSTERYPADLTSSSASRPRRCSKSTSALRPSTSSVASQRAPARLFPDRSPTPVSMSPVFLSTRHQRIACARLPDPHLTHVTRALFHIAHHDRVTAFAACGGLKPPPRRATPKGRQSFIFCTAMLQQALPTSNSLPRSDT